MWRIYQRIIAIKVITLTNQLSQIREERKKVEVQIFDQSIHNTQLERFHPFIHPSFLRNPKQFRFETIQDQPEGRSIWLLPLHFFSFNPTHAYVRCTVHVYRTFSKSHHQANNMHLNTQVHQHHSTISHPMKFKRLHFRKHTKNAIINTRRG